MASKTFNQLILGTVNGVNLAKSGCGAVAIADLVHNLDAEITPNIVAKWLINNGHLSNGGTTRQGLTAGLSHYGLDSLYFRDEHKNGKPFKHFFEILKRSEDLEMWGVALMVGDVKTYWTRGGHYVAITSYRYNKDKARDEYYVRDGANGRTGWHPLSDFKDALNVGWVVTKLY